MNFELFFEHCARYSNEEQIGIIHKRISSNPRLLPKILSFILFDLYIPKKCVLQFVDRVITATMIRDRTELIANGINSLVQLLYSHRNEMCTYRSELVMSQLERLVAYSNFADFKLELQHVHWIYKISAQDMFVHYGWNFSKFIHPLIMTLSPIDPPEYEQRILDSAQIHGYALPELTMQILEVTGRTRGPLYQHYLSTMKPAFAEKLICELILLNPNLTYEMILEQLRALQNLNFSIENVILRASTEILWNPLKLLNDLGYNSEVTITHKTDQIDDRPDKSPNIK